MRWTRSLLMVGSVALVCFVLAGALVVNVGAPDSSYKQAVLFAEILSLVIDNYVDPVEADWLLEGAYESMLNGLDPNGAYLSPAEVEEWKTVPVEAAVGPGMTVLKRGRTLQVVAVADGSSAAETGIGVGDQIRQIDGRDVQELSLVQARRLLMGRAKSRVRVEIVHPLDDFGREEIELIRDGGRGPGYTIGGDGDVGILTILDVDRIDPKALATGLGDVADRRKQLLVDVRNVAGSDARNAVEIAGLLGRRGALVLRSRQGEVLERIEVDRGSVWKGELSVLANGATADGGEALVSLLRGDDVTVYGESTFGLGAEVDLLPLENGGGLLISTRLWSPDGADSWHGEGVEPDERVRGRGDDFAAVAADQLQKTLEHLRSDEEAPAAAAG